ncbi:hypothetical protein BXZ70DRAFT_80917 [Cristinia sonorae]|uniref:Uncharacterized protein n=1 Tax=Cristinia sonorae TaxID=1940300 RepID=A0A8K0UQS7_9AGAR|nr:hypothetical protein BXZ70DRAFT_80917 [Cristinia sonorae]
MGFIDNRDPRVQYIGLWGFFPLDSDQEDVLNNTLSSTTYGSSSFRMTFDLNDLDGSIPDPLPEDTGLTISVCGGIANTPLDQNLTVSFTVDDDEPEKLSLGDYPLGNCYFQSPVVEITGTHLLTVNVTDASPSRGTLFFDYASVNTAPLAKSSSSRKSKSAGAIAGIVIGVVVFLVICIAALWAWRRKARRKAYIASRAKDLEHRMAVLSAKKSTSPPAAGPAPSTLTPTDNKVDPFRATQDERQPS